MERFDLTKQIYNFFSITPYEEITSWAVKNINFSDDISAERNYLDLQLSPHIVQPLQACGNWKNKIKQVTVVGIEQHGKTLIWQIALLYSMIYFPSQSLVVYPSDQSAAANNQTKLRPLMKHIPQLKQQLDRPRSFRADRYAFSNLISYFSGAGSKIISKSCKVRIADEVDSWPVIQNMNNVEELRKRGRSFSQSLYLKVCTPTTQNGKIWREFLKSSQGYWTLWCDQCQDWTMRSCDLNNLQFQSSYNEQLCQHIVKPNTCVLVCPKCGKQHKEEQKYQMNRKGKYIHKVPEKLELHPGFQFGVLCSLFPFMTWERIAQKILECGKRADIESHMELDGSWRGLPYKRRQIVKEEFDKLVQHCWKGMEKPDPEKIQMVFLTCDTQDDRSVVGVFAMDIEDNLYFLDARQVQYLSLSDEDREVINRDREQLIITVEDMLQKEYLGIKPLMIVMDRLGHRTTDVNYFASRHPNCIMYAGTRLQVQNWKMSDKNSRIVYVAARKYQATLIYYLYQQKKRESNYLFFYPQISNNVLKQISCVQPDTTKKFGNAPENWQPLHDASHDFFDVLKMAYFTVDFAVQTLLPQRWRFCKSPQLKRRWEKYLKNKQQQTQKIQ